MVEGVEQLASLHCQILLQSVVFIVFPLVCFDEFWTGNYFRLQTGREEVGQRYPCLTPVHNCSVGNALV
jgi:hypothetical protein